MATEPQAYYDHMNELLAQNEQLRYQIEHNNQLIEALRGKIGRVEWRYEKDAREMVQEPAAGLLSDGQRGSGDPPEETGVGQCSGDQGVLGPSAGRGGALEG